MPLEVLPWRTTGLAEDNGRMKDEGKCSGTAARGVATADADGYPLVRHAEGEIMSTVLVMDEATCHVNWDKKEVEWAMRELMFARAVTNAAFRRRPFRGY